MAEGRRPRGIFVTGTDTHVGKTVVACALAAWCRRRGIGVGVMKPVATGGRFLREGAARRWVSEDAIRLAAAAGVRDPWSLVNPICFKEPLAPWTAALRARAPIRLGTIVDAFHALRARHEFLVIEGAGGLLVPLTARTTIADMARRLDLPLLIVVRPSLGTLNHTLLSIRCAGQLGLPLVGAVINHTHPRPRDPMARLAEDTNPDILKRLAATPVLGQLPFRVQTNNEQSAAGLSDWIERHLGLRRLEQLIR